MLDENAVDEVEIELTQDDVEAEETQSPKETDAEVIEKTLIDTEEEDGEDDGDEADADADESETSTKFEMPDLGEGVEIDTELFRKVTPVLAEMNATQEQVNKLAETFAGHLKETAETHGQAMIEKYKEIKTAWKNEAKAELGVNLKPTLLEVGNALKQFGTPGLKELFNETGVGDHIEVVRFLSKVGKHFTQDSFEDGPARGGDDNVEDVLYPTMK